MVLEELLESLTCAFCQKYKDDSDLIEMNTNSIFLEDEIIEFSDLLANLLDVKVSLEQSALICEECKNVLVQFHIFKENVQNCSLFTSKTNENVKKVKMFLDENESEEVFCLRYNKCLTLVPKSKRSFMEIFNQWQPHVVLETIAELPQPRKRIKLESEEADDALESIVVVQSLEEEEAEPKNDEEMAEMREEEWLQIEMANSVIFETEEGEVESWMCKHCVPEERFFNGEEFRIHLITMHLCCEQEVVEEEEVDYRFDHESEADTKCQREELSLELSNSPKDQKAEVKVVLSCSTCNYTTENPESLRLHERKHSNLSINNKLFKSARFERLFCIDCSYQFTSQAHYQAHVNGHQIYEIVAKHSTFPVCELCNMMFCDDSLANVHHNKHEVGALVEEAIPCTGHFLKYGQYREEGDCLEDLHDVNALKCGHCLMKFADEESCRLHQLIFHVKEMKCPIENRVFTGNQAFNIHLKNNHPELFGDVKFACSVCKAEFPTLYDKLKHMKTCDKKKFQCSHCDKKFSQKCYLMTHLKQISGQASVTCEVCQKVCRDKGDYQIHFRSHSNIKPFKCSICPKAYKTSSARAAHLETHMEKGFDCTHCPTKFKSRRTLQKHVKTKHQSTSGKHEVEDHSGKIIIEEIIEHF